MSLTMIVTNAGRAALVNATNTGTAPVTIASCGVSPTAVVPAVGATALPGEIKRIATLSGDVVADDTIHLIVRDEGSDAFTLRSFALYLADGTLFAIYGQATPILEKTAQSIMLLAVDVRFADVAATSLTFGDANFLNPPATTEQIGVVELATLAEQLAGTDTQRVPAAKIIKDAVFSWLDARFGANNAGIWHPGNDGAGSGLDADLLDGQQGSFYSNIPARLGYTPANKAGETFTGDVAAPVFQVGAGAYYSFNGGSPALVFDATDYLFYDRASNQYGFVIGGASRLTVDSSGFVNASAGLRAASNLVWHAGNDGSGSGLDADLLDGQDGSWYGNIPARLGYTPASRAGDNFTGRVGFQGGGTGNADLSAAAGSLGELEVRGNGTGAAMMAFHRPGSFAGYLGVSIDNQLRWGGWSLGAVAHLVWHSGNDGSGSGMDADLLDGQDGSYYGNIPARLGYTPANRAGDTFSGPIRRDSNFYLDFAGGNPILNFDANDYVYFDRATNSVVFVMNAGVQATIGADGRINAVSGMTAAGQPVWHLGNDGSGSGLDADLLDGRHASDFMLVSGFASGGNAYGQWRKLPDGNGGEIIEQWGRISAAPNNYSTITFPIPFTDPGITTVTGSGGRNDGGAQDNGPHVASVSAASASIFSAADAAVTFFWHAIGK